MTKKKIAVAWIISLIVFVVVLICIDRIKNVPANTKTELSQKIEMPALAKGKPQVLIDYLPKMAVQERKETLKETTNKKEVFIFDPIEFVEKQITFINTSGWHTDDLQKLFHIDKISQVQMNKLEDVLFEYRNIYEKIMVKQEELYKSIDEKIKSEDKASYVQMENINNVQSRRPPHGGFTVHRTSSYKDGMAVVTDYTSEEYPEIANYLIELREALLITLNNAKEVFDGE